MCSQPYRQIAPRDTPPATGVLSTVITSTSPPRSQKFRHHASRACTSCRTAKRRCIGGIPCRSCTLNGIECALSSTEDRRRGPHTHLKNLSAKADALESIVEAIKCCDDESVQHLLEMARANQPVEQLHEVARAILEQTKPQRAGKSPPQAWTRTAQRRGENRPHKELVELLQSMTMHEAMEAVARIQAGWDIEEVVTFIKAGNLLLQMRVVPETRLRFDLPYSGNMPASLVATRSPYLSSFIYQADWMRQDPSRSAEQSEFQSLYLKPYHSATLVEPQLDRVQPSKWTTVSKDDHLMRDLLAAYFTRDYHIWPVVQKDYFLEDMANEQTECCSSLLVNALLSYACCCSSRIPRRFAYWNPHGLVYLFLAEAKRIWEMQVVTNGHRCLTSIQAVMFINAIHNVSGLDRLGNVYGWQGLAVAQEIALFDGNAHIQSPRLREASNYTAWALFNLDSITSLYFSQTPKLPRAPLARLPNPIVEVQWYGEMWTRYPMDQQLTPSSWGLSFKALSQLRIIIHQISSLAFDPNSNFPASQARIFGLRLLDWFNRLPPALSPRYMVLPAHFLLHLEYHTAMVMLHQPFVALDGQDEGYSPRDAVREAERSLNIILRLYCLRHGFEKADIYLMSPLYKAYSLCLEGIQESNSPHETEDLRSTLALVLSGLSGLGQGAYLPRTLFRLAKASMPQAELQAIQRREGSSIGDSDENNEYEQKETHSSWTPSIVSISEDPKGKVLSELVAQTWRDITVESNSSAL